MRSKDDPSLRNYVGPGEFAWLVGLSSSWAAARPQVLKGSASSPVAASGPQSAVAPQQLLESPTRGMEPAPGV